MNLLIMTTTTKTTRTMETLVSNTFPLFTYLTPTSDTLDDSDYDLSKWPVSKRCEDKRDELAKTHNVNPILAYGKSGCRIPPHEY